MNRRAIVLWRSKCTFMCKNMISLLFKEDFLDKKYVYILIQYTFAMCMRRLGISRATKTLLETILPELRLMNEPLLFINGCHVIACILKSKGHHYEAEIYYNVAAKDLSEYNNKIKIERNSNNLIKMDCLRHVEEDVSYLYINYCHELFNGSFEKAMIHLRNGIHQFPDENFDINKFYENMIDAYSYANDNEAAQNVARILNTLNPD